MQTQGTVWQADVPVWCIFCCKASCVCVPGARATSTLALSEYACRHSQGLQQASPLFTAIVAAFEQRTSAAWDAWSCAACEIPQTASGATAA